MLPWQPMIILDHAIINAQDKQIIDQFTLPWQLGAAVIVIVW